jgi:hypothetical protein
MAPHVGPQGIATRVWDALSIAITPLAAVLLLPRPNVVLMQMLDQIVHVLQITHLAAIPLAHGDLVLAEVVLGGHAGVVGRGGDGAVGVFGELAEVVVRRHVGVDGLGSVGARVQAETFAGARCGFVVGRVIGVRIEAETAAFDVFGEVVAGVVGEVRVWGVHCGGGGGWW